MNTSQNINELSPYGNIDYGIEKLPSHYRCLPKWSYCVRVFTVLLVSLMPSVCYEKPQEQ